MVAIPLIIASPDNRLIGIVIPTNGEFRVSNSNFMFRIPTTSASYISPRDPEQAQRSKTDKASIPAMIIDAFCTNKAL